jgi:thiamine biosynthesis lipoprotein
VISASVIADKPEDAGALVTVLNVLSPEEGKALVATIPRAEYMLIAANGRIIKSDGWKKLETASALSAAKTTASVSKDKLWDPKYELALNLELASLEGMRVHRPYVAIWVLNADKKPVRQISLWYNKLKYLVEMRS